MISQEVDTGRRVDHGRGAIWAEVAVEEEAVEEEAVMAEVMAEEAMMKNGAKRGRCVSTNASDKECWVMSVQYVPWERKSSASRAVPCLLLLGICRSVPMIRYISSKEEEESSSKSSNHRHRNVTIVQIVPFVVVGALELLLLVVVVVVALMVVVVVMVVVVIVVVMAVARGLHQGQVREMRVIQEVSSQQQRTKRRLEHI